MGEGFVRIVTFDLDIILIQFTYGDTFAELFIIVWLFGSLHNLPSRVEFSS